VPVPGRVGVETPGAEGAGRGAPGRVDVSELPPEAEPSLLSPSATRSRCYTGAVGRGENRGGPLPGGSGGGYARRP
jgi:hypothetical protein